MEGGPAAPEFVDRPVIEDGPGAPELADLPASEGGGASV
jgi:hypothetical protein